jgi:hypothetical protein
MNQIAAALSCGQVESSNRLKIWALPSNPVSDQPVDFVILPNRAPRA